MSSKDDAGGATSVPFMRYSIIIEWFYTHAPNRVDVAIRQFLDEVDTDVDLAAPTEQADHLQRLFHEWFLFDFRLPDGNTPLLFAASPAGGRALGLSRRKRDDIREAADSQIVSLFWIVGVSAADHLVHLEEVHTGEWYAVRDVAASGQLDGRDYGMLSGRLVRVGGTWYLAGNPVAEFPVKPTQRMKDALRQSGGVHEVRFIDLIRERYGSRLRGGGNIGGNGGDAGGGAGAGAVDDDSTPLGTPYDDLRRMDDAEFAAFKEGLRSRYEEFRAKLPDLPDWWTVYDAIFDEDGSTTPMDVFARLFSDRHGDPRLDDRSGFRDFVSLFTDLWNVLPHRVLDGLSPNEVFEGQRGVSEYRHDPDHPRPCLDQLDMIAAPTSYGFAFDAFPPLKPYEILGIERRDLEAFARRLAAGATDSLARMRDAFLSDLPHWYFEEDVLHAMLIGRMAKMPDEALHMLDAFLPHVRNRKVCDCLRVLALRRDPAVAYRRLVGWLSSDEPYTVRFAILTLMRDFKGDDFDEDQARLVAGVTLGDDASCLDPWYDVRLAREWYFGVRLVESPDVTIPLVEHGLLPVEVRNAALRRAIKSRRIDDALRVRLRGLIVPTTAGRQG